LRLGDLGLVGDALLVEHAQRADLTGAPDLEIFGWVVDVGLGVLADQLRRRLAAGLVRQVGEFRAGLLLHEHGQHVIFALGAGAAHLERRACGLGGGDEFLHRLRAFGIVPQHELIERDHRYRRQVAPVEGDLGRQRQHVDQRIGDQHLVGITVAGLHVH
jgi:hypothetical protein